MTGPHHIRDALARMRSGPSERDLAALKEGSKALQDEFAAVGARTFEGTDAGEYVTIRVKGDGAVESVKISARAIRDLDEDAIGAACMDAMANAMKDVAAALADVTSSLRDVFG